MTGTDTQTPRPKIAAMERGIVYGNSSVHVCAGHFSIFFFVFLTESNNSITCAGPGPARYALPSLTGREGHSPTKALHPAYSFGRKLGGGCKYSNSEL